MAVTVPLSYDQGTAPVALQGHVSTMDSNLTEQALGEYTRYYRELLGF